MVTRNRTIGGVAFERYQNGRVDLTHNGRTLTFSRPEVEAIAGFLQEGPPKKEWIITRRFHNRPVTVGIQSSCGSGTTALTNADVEEVE